ncbi:MAG: metalloregulator ArsR/SmtB family transcription factor, partial [Gammaproteobacteria bacterium]|nr:metalloregulator ArsR/SmtB family transcription factor [Gammaproteobacteria bacterium]
MLTLDTLLAGLRAAAEHTRLRILALCARGELSVSELTQILGQSQPRVSRHLKLMVAAGLLERLPEGSQVYFRLSDSAVAVKMIHLLKSLTPVPDAALNRDLSRLYKVRDARAQKAQDYFQQVAKTWDSIRSMHVTEQQLEQALCEVVGADFSGNLLDIGTGTGRILELFADRINRGVGVDMSNGMLAVARSNLERDDRQHIHVRKGDMYQLPLDQAEFDLAILHMVLHYSDSPVEVIREAARILRPSGRLIVVDFASHTEEYLRSDYQHYRLGFADSEILQCFESAGLRADMETRQLAGDPLTVKIWVAQKQPNPATGSSSAVLPQPNL